LVIDGYRMRPLGLALVFAVSACATQKHEFKIDARYNLSTAGGTVGTINVDR